MRTSIANRRLLRRVGYPGVMRPSGMQADEINVLRHDDAPVLCCEFEMNQIVGGMIANVLRTNHVDATAT